MKYLIFILFFTISSTNIFAETSEDALARGRVLDQYATITGGWYLEKKCNALSQSEMREFEWHIFHIGQTMQKTTSRSMLLMMQKSAENTANSEKYSSCNNESKEIVKNTFKISRKLNKELNNKIYIKDLADKETDFKKFSAASIVTTISIICPDYLDDKSKMDIKNKFGAINNKLIDAYGISFANYAVTLSKKINNIKNTIECNDKTKIIYFNGIRRLKALANDLEI